MGQHQTFFRYYGMPKCVMSDFQRLKVMKYNQLIKIWYYNKWIALYLSLIPLYELFKIFPMHSKIHSNY